MLSRGPLDVLDHAAPRMGLGGKLAFDLTGVDPDGAVPPVGLPQRWENCYGVERADDSLCASWGVLLLYAASSVVPDVPAFLRRNGVSYLPLAVLLDAGAYGFSYGDLLWLASSNCDPSRDVAFSGGTAIFDARTKAGGVNGFARRWPNVVASSPETIARVDARWEEYGLGPRTESPSLRYLKLQRRASAEY